MPDLISLLHFLLHSGVVQSVARGPLEPEILVRVQAPEPLTFILLFLLNFNGSRRGVRVA